MKKIEVSEKPVDYPRATINRGVGDFLVINIEVLFYDEEVEEKNTNNQFRWSILQFSVTFTKLEIKVKDCFTRLVSCHKRAMKIQSLSPESSSRRKK